MYDTIAALSTPTGGALALIRLSGPKSGEILARVFSGRVEPRRVSYGRLTWEGELIDTVTAVFFAGPHSFTGEDMAEITAHGGQAVVRRALDAVLQAGARPAEPGEFTRRAFLNGKLDLSQAEAVMDLISAESQRGAKSAAQQLAGGVSRRINSIADALADALSGVNAAIDYPEELEEDVFSGLPETLSRACAELEELIQNGLRARVVREGAKVVLVGRPNAGKSSLYNALLGQDRAIVTQYPGTTRDVLTEPTQFLGLPVLLTDTAGLRPTHEPVERIGVERAQAALEQAEFLLLVLDSSQALAREDVALIEETDGRPRLGVLAKADLPPALDEEELAVLGLPSLRVSAVTGLGLPALCRRVAEQLLPEDYPVWITNARHIQALERAREALGSALSSREPDCVATDLTAALAELYSITGQSVSEEVIARIFRRFCVGK